MLNKFNTEGFKIISVSPVFVKKMKDYVNYKISRHNVLSLQKDTYFKKHFDDKIKRSFSPEIDYLANIEAYKISKKHFNLIGYIPFVDKFFIKKYGILKTDFFFRIVRKNKLLDIGFPHTDKFFWDLAKKKKILPPFSKCKKRVKVWIPLIGCDSKNSLKIYNKSHLNKNSFVMTKKLRGNEFRPKTKDNLRSFKTSVPVFCNNKNNQAVLFHDNLIHSGQVNNSSNFRISAEFHIIME